MKKLLKALGAFRGLSAGEIRRRAIFPFPHAKVFGGEISFIVLWWQLVVQVTINSVNMMEWRQSFSSLFCSLFCFWAYHRNLSLPCVLSHFHQHHQIGTGGKSCYANILGGNIRRREKMECTMAQCSASPKASLGLNQC